MRIGERHPDVSRRTGQTRKRRRRSALHGKGPTTTQDPRVVLTIHLDKHVAINISQRLHDAALGLVALLLIEVRRGLVRLD
jgi:hypothetical protein